MKTAYLAGPMRGYDQFNFPAFDEAAATLRGWDWDVLSPAEHDRLEGFDETKNSLGGFDMAAAMRWDIGAVLDADAIVLLPGWENSAGVAIELSVARAIGIEVWEYDPNFTGAVRRLSEPDLTVLQEADKLINGQRQSDYGHPIDNFTQTGRIWGAILNVPDIPAETVGLMMIGAKISRETNVHKRDNLVDAAGYAGTVAKVIEERSRREGT